MQESINFYIRTISPIHIGCDEVYEPSGFVLDENNQQMILFDPLSFISQMGDADKAKFSKICAKGTVDSILELYKFMQGKTAEGRKVDVCHDFLDHYKNTLSIPLKNKRNIQQNLNNFAIPRSAFRSFDQRPYIPGSSLKGALRTAYLNIMEYEKELSKKGKQRNAKILEQRLMEYKGIPTDPFRMVKVSDFMPMGGIRTRIVYGVNEKKKTADHGARGLPLIFEVIPPDIVFVGTISVDSPLQRAGISKPVSIEKLLNSATKFYTNEKRREDRELTNIGVVVDPDYGRFQNQKKSFLVRVGRHSGAESVTIEGHRKILIMGEKGKKKYSDRATTLWLASEERKPTSRNDLKPFGWIELSIITSDSLKKFQIKQNDWQAKQDFDREQKLKPEQKTAEEFEKLTVKQDKKREEEERKRAELEAMGPEERDIALVQDGQLQEKQAVEIYNRIDDFSPENKFLLAKALKEYWLANKKWSGKLSNKQKIKVRKVKALLG